MPHAAALLALCLCLWAAALPQGASVTVSIQPNRTYSGTVGDGQRFVLREGVPPDYFLTVLLSADDAASNASIAVQAHVTDQTGRFLQDVLAPNPNDETTIQTLCQSASSFSPPTAKHGEKEGGTKQYWFDMLGTQGAKYTFGVQLDYGALSEGIRVLSRVQYHARYFFFDVERTDAPLRVSVKSHSKEGGQEVLAVLKAVYDNCPLLSSPSGLPPGHKNAMLTFDRQAVLTVAQFAPELEIGRWYIAIVPESYSKAKNFSIEASYGMKYDDYDKRTLSLLFVYPAALVALSALPFSVTFCINKGRWTDKSLFTKKRRSIDKQLSKKKRKGIKEKARRARDEEEEEERDGDSSTEPSPTEEKRLIKQMQRRNARKLKEKAQYSPYVIICSMFFIVPALQVATREASAVRDEGDRDVCYYNELCMKPTQWVNASNNLWSNVGYMWSGLILVAYVFLSKRILKFKRLVAKDCTVIYAVSIAIFFEGVLSATYHICPNRTIFQFDTAFMFIITGLLVVELYRKYFHTHFAAWVPFTFFGLLLVVNYIGSIIDISHQSSRRTARVIFRAALTALLVALALVLVFAFYLKPKNRQGEEMEQEYLFRERRKRKKATGDREGSLGVVMYHWKVLRFRATLFFRKYDHGWHPMRLLALLTWLGVSLAVVWVAPDSDLSQTLLGLMVTSFLVWLLSYFAHKIRRAIIGAYRFSQLRFAAQENRLLAGEEGRDDTTLTAAVAEEEAEAEAAEEKEHSCEDDEATPLFARPPPKTLHGSRSCFAKAFILFAEINYAWTVLAVWLMLALGTLAFWLVALYYFSVLTTTDKNLTPAQSRDRNSDCVLFEFWDAHDVWHITGAVALFFGTLFVMHMDVQEEKSGYRQRSDAQKVAQIEGVHIQGE